MSYGFYKMPPRSSHEDYIIKVAGKTHIAIAVTDHTTEDLKPVQPDSITTANTPEILEPPKVSETLLQVQRGYSGDVCDNCHGSRLRWAGHCKVCDDCGTTTGCS